MSLANRVRRKLKGSGKAKEWQHRQETWSERALPSFIILGAQKAGTSSLHTWLSDHPQLLPPFTKEVHFFDGGKHPDVDDFAKGEQLYRAYFPRTAEMGPDQQTFEASPLYLSNAWVPERIAGMLPDVKLIALLRNPIDRAISHYKHEKQRDLEDLSLIEALRAEEERIRPALDRGDYKDLSYARKCYQHRGRYAEQIERFHRNIDPSRLLILEAGQLFQHPHETLAEVHQFLGVEPFHNEDVRPRNVANITVDPDPAARQLLAEYFAPHNEALFQQIGRRFDW